MLPAVTVVSLLSGSDDDTRSRMNIAVSSKKKVRTLHSYSLPTTAKGPVCPVAGPTTSECGTNP